MFTHCFVMPSSKPKSWSVYNVSFYLQCLNFMISSSLAQVPYSKQPVWNTGAQWLSYPFYSLEIRCERLDIDNAIHPDRYTVSYRYSEKVTYQCREGFTGRPTRTCSENGWTGDSQCTSNYLLSWLLLVNLYCSDDKLCLSLEITCNRKSYPDADIEGPSKSLYTYKEEVVYVCKKGYEGGFTLTCGNGWWLGTNNCKSK